MKTLLYCIVRTGETREPGCPLGVDGQPVSLVGAGGLSAVTSRIGGVDLSPDLPRILAFKKVVEAFHHAQTVIPMRFACLLDEPSAVARLLAQRRQPYEAILKELDGCAEMGVRIIPDSTDPGPPPPVDDAYSAHGISPRGDAPHQPQAGQAYLAAQKLLYAARDRLTRDEERLAGRVCAHLAEHFIRCKTEPSAPGRHRLISVALLAPRGSVPALRTAFRQLCSWETAKLLLSGPWPPYSFAQPERATSLSLGL